MRGRGSCRAPAAGRRAWRAATTRRSTEPIQALLACASRGQRRVSARAARPATPRCPSVSWGARPDKRGCGRLARRTRVCVCVRARSGWRPADRARDDRVTALDCSLRARTWQSFPGAEPLAWARARARQRSRRCATRRLRAAALFDGAAKRRARREQSAAVSSFSLEGTRASAQTARLTSWRPPQTLQRAWPRRPPARQRRPA
jgi:hypothetical protein